MDDNQSSHDDMVGNNAAIDEFLNIFNWVRPRIRAPLCTLCALPQPFFFEARLLNTCRNRMMISERTSRSNLENILVKIKTG